MLIMTKQEAHNLLWKMWEAEKLAQGWRRLSLFLPAPIADHVQDYVREHKPKYLQRSRVKP